MNTHTDILSEVTARAFGLNPNRIPPEIEAEIGRRMLERESVYHTPQHAPKKVSFDPTDPPKRIKGWGLEQVNAAAKASRDQRRSMIPDLVANGYTVTDIAAAFGLCRDVIWKDLRVLGLKAQKPIEPNRRRSMGRLNKVRQHWELSDAMIAGMLGVHKRTVREYRRQIRRQDEADG